MSTQPPLSESELCPPGLLAAQEAAYERDCARLRERARLSPVACPACGRDQPGQGIAKDGFTWATCPGCSTLYMTPRPSPADLAEHYASSLNHPALRGNGHSIRAGSRTEADS